MKMLCILLCIVGIGAGALVAWPAGKARGRREATGARPDGDKPALFIG